MSDDVTTAEKTWKTPFNIITGIIVIIGLFITILRFTGGLATVTNLSDYNPWGYGSVLTCYAVLPWPFWVLF